MHKVKAFDKSADIFPVTCGSDNTENQQIQIVLEKNGGRKIDKTVVVQTKHVLSGSFPDYPRDSQAEQYPAK